jgi:HlyD family secretion protein
MARLRPLLFLLALGAAGYAGYQYATAPPTSLVLTGIVTTHDVAVGPQIGGRVEQLLVKEGDAVTAHQLLAVIAPAELEADRAYYAHTAARYEAEVQESEAALRYQEKQTVDQIAQAEASLAAAQSEQMAARADLERARVTLGRIDDLARAGLATRQQLDEARTARDGAEARVEALGRQVDAQRSTIALARDTAEQIAVKRSQVRTSQAELAAAGAQRAKADVRLAYTQVQAPRAGIVDVRVAREGEVVTAGQPLVTLVDPDDYWVRADIEETYVDRVKMGDTLTVRLPSGDERQGTVFYRRQDAGFATQRDVSRTKRDIRTFEVRLRVDNRDRALAVGMTAYVLLPLTGSEGTATAAPTSGGGSR